MNLTHLSSPIEIVPATRERWPDLESLLGPNGACAGCWCMFWRLDRKDYKRLQGAGNKAALQALTGSALPPGVLAYRDGRVIGWCAVGPRQDFIALETSRSLKRIDDTPVWSVVCFYIAKKERRSGLHSALLHGAVDFARRHGAAIVEGYPIDLQTGKLAGQKLRGVAGYMGIASVYHAAGFVEAARASETQLIMRLKL
jgi:GNAT superfamily N-acetyltransferase